MIDSGDVDGAGRIGTAVLTGILTFLVLEKVLEISNPESNQELRDKENKKIVGYLNLLANCTDNRSMVSLSVLLSSPASDLVSPPQLQYSCMKYHMSSETLLFFSGLGLTDGKLPK